MGLQLFDSWQHIPPSSHTKRKREYRTLIQFWQALRERNWVLGQEVWPRCSFQWISGVVASIADNGDGTFTLTDGSTPLADWTNVFSPLPGVTYIPSSFDVIISYDDVDPSKQIRAAVTGHSATTGGTPGTLTVSSYVDYVTAGVIGSITPPSGAKYFVIKRGGLWWGDKNPDLMRWPDYPNDFEIDLGTVASAASGTATLTSIDPDLRFSDDSLAGKNLMVYDTDGKLHRAIITANHTDTLTGKSVVSFSGTWTATGDYSVVTSGAMCFPGRTNRSRPFWSYSGSLDSYYVHDPDDPRPPVARPVIATQQIGFSDGTDSAFCPTDSDAGYQHNALHQDVWSDPQNVCGPPDECYTPKMYKSLVSIQSEIERMSGSFVPSLDYPVAGRNPKQTFTPALLFYVADINAGSTTVADKDGTGHFHASIGTGYAGRSVYFSVIKSDAYGADAGKVRMDSTATVLSDGTIDLGTGLYNDDDELADPTHYSDVGSEVVWSLGWTRRCPKRFRNMYARAGFIPDDSGGVGQWIKRAASTALMEFDDLGFASESGPAFQTGDLAMYMGENWTYPIDPGLPGDSDADALQYYDRFSEHRHLPETQELIEADARGKITAHTAYSLTDSTKDWWAEWYGGGAGRVESGTATSASSTALTDSSKIGSDYWADDRFVGYAHPWEGFILEVDHGGQTYQLPITGATASTGQVTFDSVGVTFGTGDAYRIREPGTMLNRYAGKTATIRRADGTTFDLVIDRSDRDTLYFSGGVPAGGFTDGWTYQIHEWFPGGTYRWDGAAWTVPAGADDRGGGNFQAAPESNAPDWRLAYGRIAKLDYVSIDVMAEMRRAIDALVATPSDFAWTSRAEPTEPENNANQPVLVGPYPEDVTVGDGHPTYADIYDIEVSILTDAWDGSMDIWTGIPISGGGGVDPHATPNIHELDAAPPNARGTSRIDVVFGDVASPDPAQWQDWSIAASVNRVYSYGKLAVLGGAGHLAASVDFYSYCGVDTDDHPQGTIGNDEYTFDHNGDPVTYHQWQKFSETGDENTLAYRVSDRLGSIEAQPNIPLLPVPTDNTPYTSTQGYFAVDKAAVIRWDGAGGMRFVA